MSGVLWKQTGVGSEKGNSGGELPREARMCLGTKRSKVVLGILCGVFGSEVEGSMGKLCSDQKSPRNLQFLIKSS